MRTHCISTRPTGWDSNSVLHIQLVGFSSSRLHKLFCGLWWYNLHLTSTPRFLTSSETKPDWLTQYRTTRGYICEHEGPSHSNAPTHLLKRYHLSRPLGLSRLDTYTKRGKHMHESPEHVDWKYQEWETRRGFTIRGKQPKATTRHRFLLPWQYRVSMCLGL